MDQTIVSYKKVVNMFKLNVFAKPVFPDLNEKPSQQKFLH